MKLVEKIFGFINGIFLFIFLFGLLKYSAAIVGMLTSTIGILIIFLLLILPLIMGIIYSLKHVTQQTKGLSGFEKMLIAFPLLNLLIICGFILMMMLA